MKTSFNTEVIDGYRRTFYRATTALVYFALFGQISGATSTGPITTLTPPRSHRTETEVVLSRHRRNGIVSNISVFPCQCLVNEDLLTTFWFLLQKVKLIITGVIIERKSRKQMLAGKSNPPCESQFSSASSASVLHVSFFSDVQTEKRIH